jgi:VWFA-related protein
MRIRIRPALFCLLAIWPTVLPAAPVNLNVIALDTQGRSAADLTAEDFQVTDNGKARRILWVHAVSPKRSPAVFILLDLLNSDLARRSLSANEIAQALEKLEADNNVYLYVLTEGGKVFPVHAVAAARRESPADKVPWTRRVRPLLDDALREVSSLTPQYERDRSLRMEPTWKALGGLLGQMAEVPGPKSFVWITEGVENGYYDEARQFRRDITPLRNFAFNLAALQTLAYSVAQRPNGEVLLEDEGSRGDTLAEVSALAGGRMFPPDHTEQAILAGIDNARQMNYRIVFEADRMDGKYHKLRVTAARKGLSIQTADHYYAVAEGPAETARLEFMENAIGASPFEFDAIGLAIQTRPETAADLLHISIRANTQDLELLQQGGRYKGSLAIAFEAIHADGHRRIVETQPEVLDLSEPEYAKALRDGIVLTRDAKLDAGASQVRAIVLDRNSWLAGTATLPSSK